MFAKNGADTRIIKALDILRITGNNAVHPGTLDLDDDTEIAGKLFNLMNFIVHKMITYPKELEDFYESMSKGAKDGIKKRDNK